MSKNLKKSNEIIHIKKSGEVVSEKNNKGNKAIDCPMTSSITISLLSFSGKLYVYMLIEKKAIKVVTEIIIIKM